jgi:hypothetical protein
VLPSNLWGLFALLLVSCNSWCCFSPNLFGKFISNHLVLFPTRFADAENLVGLITNTQTTNSKIFANGFDHWHCILTSIICYFDADTLLLVLTMKLLGRAIYRIIAAYCTKYETIFQIICCQKVCKITRVGHFFMYRLCNGWFQLSTNFLSRQERRNLSL